MTYFPSVRTKNRVNAFTGEETEEPNGYWEGNLNEYDKQFLRGYDWAVQEIYDFFDSLDDYEEEFLLTRFNVNFIAEPPVRDPERPDEEVYSVGDGKLLPREYKDLSDYSEEQIMKMTPETAIIIAMRASAMDYMETQRNMAVISILDDYDEEEPESDSDAEKSAGSD